MKTNLNVLNFQIISSFQFKNFKTEIEKYISFKVNCQEKRIKEKKNFVMFQEKLKKEEEIRRIEKERRRMEK
jgi:hypothetical protein